MEQYGPALVLRPLDLSRGMARKWPVEGGGERGAEGVRGGGGGASGERGRAKVSKIDHLVARQN